MFTDYIRDKYVKLFRIYTKLNCYKLFRLYRYTEVKNKLNFYFKQIYFDETHNDVKDIKINIRNFHISYYFIEKIIYLPLSLKELYIGTDIFYIRHCDLGVIGDYKLDLLYTLPLFKTLFINSNFSHNLINSLFIIHKIDYNTDLELPY
jgi:hypothetical protein